MKKIIRIFWLSLLVMVLTININYAAIENAEKADKSLGKMFSNDIKIENNSSKETILIKGQKIQNLENEIKLSDENSQQEHYIKYNFENNIYKFESITPIDLKSNSSQEEVVKELSVIMNQLGNFDICYLTVADILGVDHSLAYTYYAQNYNNETIDTQNKIYSIKTNFEDVEKDITSINNFSIELQVNCLELVKLSLSDIDKSDTYTVTVIGNEEVKPPVDQEQEEQEENKDNQIQQDKPVVKDDKTTVEQEMPKAGINKMLGVIIFGIIIFTVIMYKQNQKYKGII